MTELNKNLMAFTNQLTLGNTNIFGNLLKSCANNSHSSIFVSILKVNSIHTFILIYFT